MTRLDGKEYRITKKLGEGSFGVVFKGDKLSKDGPLLVAIKFVGDPP
jgi:serine/threonine protein kinase